MTDIPYPYNTTTHKEGFYAFTTDLGLEYSCVFNSGKKSLHPILRVYDIEVFMFDFFHSSQSIKGRKTGTDERVAVTIKHLLADFFARNPNGVIAFTCDFTDNRGKCRDIVFKKWYTSTGSSYYCQNIEIVMDGIDTIYGAVITRSDFQNYEILEEHVIKNAQAIMVEKYIG